MSQPAKGCLYAPDDDGSIRIGASDPLAIGDHRPVRPCAHLPARGVGILCPALLSNRIVIDHGIHVPGRYEEPEPRAPELSERIRISHVGLSQDGDLIALSLQQASDDSHAERGMVNIGIPRYVNEIRGFPPRFAHLLGAYGQEAMRFHQGRKPPSQASAGVVSVGSMIST